MSGSNFEVDTDANLKVDGPPDCIDWLAGGAGTPFRAGVLAKDDKPSGATDDSFGQGSKEDDPNPTIVTGSIPPNKSDLKTFGVYAETTTTSKFLELFWSRIQNPSGTTNMDFELNQKFCDPAAIPTNCANNGVGVTPETPVRTIGDKLITYDLAQGGVTPTISIRTWTGAAWGPATDITASGQALGSVNSSTIVAAGSGGLGGQNPFTFGEAAISFAALFPNPGQCGTLGSVYLKSRSSDSFQSEIKDFVAPERVSISNCTALTTTAQNSVTLGNPIFDVAHLTGATLGAGGTITFRLFKDDNTCALANEVATALAPVAVNGNGDYNSGNYTPTATGRYYWTAIYSGDANNTGSATACNDADETSRVVDAKILITPPSATNRIGQAHTFTVTLLKDTGTAAGFQPAAGEHVAFTLTDTNGALSVLNAAASTCDDAGQNTDVNGQCTIVFSSNLTGKVTGHASSTLTLAGLPVTVETDGLGLNSGNAVKTYVNAKILITPPTATNRVGQAHTFTVSLWKDLGDGLGFVKAQNEHVGFTLTDSLGAASTLDAAASTCDNADQNTDLNGQCTIVFNSSSTGKVTGHASSTLTLAGLPVTVETDGLGLNSGNAVKTYVNAKISIAPSATNRIGQAHTFTVTLLKDTGTAAGFQPAAGEHVAFTLTDTNGALSVLNAAASTCDDAGANTDANGQCTIVFNSNSTGKVTGHASASLTIGTTTFSVATGSGGLNSADAVKTYVNAKISIAQTATNEVGQPHTFIVTLEKDTGNGAGLVPAANEDVDFSLTDSNGATSTLNAASSTCDDAGNNTDANGQCTIVFNSNTAGKVTGHASSTLTLAGLQVTVQTDNTGLNSGNAVKTYVDANIQITPATATNPLNTDHTLTGHVNVNTGTGGFVNAPDGTTINFSLINTGGATASFVGPNSCTTAGGTGSCDVVIKSSTAGTTTIKATTDVTVGGLLLHRATGDAKVGDSIDATKKWASAKITITPNAVNEIGQPHTFTVTLEKDPGTGIFVPAPNEDVDFTLTNSNNAGYVLDTAASTCDDAGNNTDANGQCTITFTSPTAGKVTGHASSTLTIGGATINVATDGTGSNSVDAVKTFVDANIQINPPSATNRVGDTHTFTAHVNVNDGSGFANAAGKLVSFTIDSGPGSLSNGNASPTSCTTNANGNCTIDLVSNVTGVTTISAHTTFTVGGVSLTRHTNGNAANSVPATKTWANAKIKVAPDATNEVGDPHTFQVTLEQDPGTGVFGPAANEHVDFTLANSNNAGYVLDAAASTCDDLGTNTDANGQCTITFTSPTAGKVTAHASSTLSVNGSAPFTIETDGVAPNSGNAVKTFVDANIQITPAEATNPLNTTHVLTGHVNVNTGSGGFANAPNGTIIDFTLLSGPATFVGPHTCTTTAGSCTVTITSTTTGVSKIRAATDVLVGGLTLHRASGDGKVGDSIDATKNWASAKIAIAPDATHEIGQTHTFTVTLMKDTANGTFVPAAGEHVDVTLTDANGANHTAPTGTCMKAGANTDAGGQCTISLTSNLAGTVTAHAASTLTVSGVAISVQTNGIAPNSGNAVARFVDANIQVTPATAINPTGTTHTLTGHVNVNTGSGAFANAPAGTTINFSLAGPAAFVGPSSCTTAGGTGSCTVVISSATIGTSTIKASTDVTVGGVTLHRESGDGKAGDSANASKLWADDTVRTDILNASGGVVTSVVAGTIVHDKVFVATAAGTPAGVPNPTGTVIFHRFATIDCTGTPITNQTVALTVGSPSTAITDDFAPVSDMSYRADYLGDANYPARSGACEPLTVTPVLAPSIAIVKNPKAQTVAVGGTATFTITVTNSGNAVLTDVTVVDPLTPSCNRTKTEIPALASMAPGASVTYSCTKTNVRASFDNVATAIGTPPSGPNVTASDTAPVKAAPLTPKKKKVVKKKKPKVVSHKKPKATG